MARITAQQLTVRRIEPNTDNCLMGQLHQQSIQNEGIKTRRGNLWERYHEWLSPDNISPGQTWVGHDPLSTSSRPPDISRGVKTSLGGVKGEKIKIHQQLF